MSTYRITYTTRSRQDLRKLPRDIAQEAIRAISAISDNPYQHVKKLKGCSPKQPIYSFRVRRTIRAFLSIHDDILIIHVLEVVQRKSAYRDF
jgi:mRNA interferase RelE/StbE